MVGAEEIENEDKIEENIDTNIQSEHLIQIEDPQSHSVEDP